MQPIRDYIQKAFRYKLTYNVIGIYLVVIIFLSVTLYGGTVLYSAWNELSYLNTEVENSKSTVEFIGVNRDVVAEGLDSYNETLGDLIPDEESYFSVVSALERVAEKSGVTINAYTIDLESTNISTLSLRVEVSGSEEALEKLLSLYTYGGGRLITIEKVDISRTGELVNVFLFNFYHQPFTVGSAANTVQLTQKDVDLLKEIQTQMN